MHWHRALAMLPLLALATLGQPIPLSGNGTFFRYDGHGGLSAGASSRLLLDYPEPQRSEILDYLWKPQFGASLHMMEIGGDTQSTDGTEPSYRHFREEAPVCGVERGYEMWLLVEAYKRNPLVQSYILSWGVPNWVGNGTFFSSDNIDYQVGYATCVRENIGKSPDYIGIWNERSFGSLDYIITLRQALDAAGHDATRIIVPDGGDCAEISSAAASNATFAAAVYALGEHYPCKRACPAAIEAGLKFWASEDYSTVADWAGAGCWGRSLSQNWVLLNSSSTISWSTIWSVYPKDSYFGNGLMYAFSPWSGNYIVNDAIWTSAHHTQFMTPGWHLLQGSEGKGMLPGGGSYMTALSPSGTDFTLILETLAGRCLRCATGSVQAQNLTFSLGAGLPTPPGTVLKAWQTTEGAAFVALPDVAVGAGGSLAVSIPADAILTLSTITTAQHGAFPASPIPPDAPFPLPYASDFGAQGEDTLPRYFADQGGSFAVRGGVVQQVVGADPGPNGWGGNRDPASFIGDASWTDVAVRVSVAFNGGPPAGQPGSSSAGAAAAAAPLAAANGEPAAVAPCVASGAPSAGQSWLFSKIAPGYLSTATSTPAASQCLNAPGCSTTEPLIYYTCVTTGCQCGCPTFTNLQWAYAPATGAITTGMSATLCLTLAADGALVLLPCAPATRPEQVWGYNASSGQVFTRGGAGGSGEKCLTAPTPPPPPPPKQPYMAITTRMAGQGSGAAPGYSFGATEAGSWWLLAGSQHLANGTIPGSFNASQWHIMELSAVGSALTGAVDGVQLFSLSDARYSAGQVGMGSGYHYASFKDFEVRAAP